LEKDGFLKRVVARRAHQGRIGKQIEVEKRGSTCVENAKGERVADVAGQEEPELVATADHLLVMKNRDVAGEELGKG
jgi:hypothetical protein